MIEVFYTCPYCWQRVSILLDPAVGHFREIEDCEVCCNPILFTIELSGGEVCSLNVERVQ
ncbi:CPXCG motif-containing cysteine-rich protein [Nitratifractor sp.]